MALNLTLEKTYDTAKITLSGELDASTAEIFKNKVEEAAATDPKRLVLIMKELEYMASAGLRVLIFAKQKMKDVDLYVVGAQKDTVLKTIEHTGFDKSVILLDTYDE
jgi:anti-anti-sigma factor